MRKEMEEKRGVIWGIKDPFGVWITKWKGKNLDKLGEWFLLRSLSLQIEKIWRENSRLSFSFFSFILNKQQLLSFHFSSLPFPSPHPLPFLFSPKLLSKHIVNLNFATEGLESSIVRRDIRYNIMEAMLLHVCQSSALESETRSFFVDLILCANILPAYI